VTRASLTGFCQNVATAAADVFVQPKLSTAGPPIELSAPSRAKAERFADRVRDSANVRRLHLILF